MRTYRTKSAPLRLKRTPSDGSGTFTAVVSTFGPPPDEQGDIISVGAFDKSIAGWRRKGVWPTLWWQHGYDNPENAVGRLTSMQATHNEVIVGGKLDLASDRGLKIYEGMLGDRLREFSIGYAVYREHRDHALKCNVLDEIDVIEVSVVASGANRNTRLLEVKSAGAKPRGYRDRAGHPLPPPTVLAPNTHPASVCKVDGSVNVWAPSTVSDAAVKREIKVIRAALPSSTRWIDPEVAHLNRTLDAFEFRKSGPAATRRNVPTATGGQQEVAWYSRTLDPMETVPRG